MHNTASTRLPGVRAPRFFHRHFSRHPPLTLNRHHQRKTCVLTAAADFKSENLYLTLGVSPGASLSALKQAYREAAKRWHPDVCSATDAPEKFLAAQIAYHTLLEDRGGTLESVGGEEARRKWKDQIDNLEKRQKQRRKETHAKRMMEEEFESAEERKIFQQLKKNVFMYENIQTKTRVHDQMKGLQDRSGRKRRQNRKSSWVEPINMNFDDGEWCHEVQ